MSPNGNFAPWFAVNVKLRLENAVAEALRTKGYETLAPRTGDRSSPVLFPGYVLCRFDGVVRGPIVTTAGVIRIVGTGGRPTPIDPIEIANLMKVVRSGEELRCLPRLCAGDPVEIISGPLSGCWGVLINSDKHLNFVISICLLGRSVALAFRPEWVVKARSPHAREEIYAR